MFRSWNLYLNQLILTSSQTPPLAALSSWHRAANSEESLEGGDKVTHVSSSCQVTRWSRNVHCALSISHSISGLQKHSLMVTWPTKLIYFANEWCNPQCAFWFFILVYLNCLRLSVSLRGSLTCPFFKNSLMITGRRHGSYLWLFTSLCCLEQSISPCSCVTSTLSVSSSLFSCYCNVKLVVRR